jgi:hypothetical protein
MFSIPGRNAALAIPSVALFFLVAGCESDDPTPQVPDPITQIAELAWVAIEPTQCLTNPWEADWLEHHGGNYAAYPKDPAKPGLEPEEVAIIEDYYQRQGVVVSAAETAPKFDVVCLACNCPEGHTMFLRVRGEDVDTMTALGYRVESPPDGE